MPVKLLRWRCWTRQGVVVGTDGYTGHAQRSTLGEHTIRPISERADREVDMFYIRRSTIWHVDVQSRWTNAGSALTSPYRAGKAPPHGSKWGGVSASPSQRERKRRSRAPQHAWSGDRCGTHGLITAPVQGTCGAEGADPAHSATDRSEQDQSHTYKVTYTRSALISTLPRTSCPPTARAARRRP